MRTMTSFGVWIGIDRDIAIKELVLRNPRSHWTKMAGCLSHPMGIPSTAEFGVSVEESEISTVTEKFTPFGNGNKSKHVGLGFDYCNQEARRTPELRRAPMAVYMTRPHGRPSGVSEGQTRPYCEAVIKRAVTCLPSGLSVEERRELHRRQQLG